MNAASLALSERLLPHERLLWSGSPARGFLLQPRDAFLIPFSLLWLSFVLFWIHGAGSAGAPLPFLAFGAVFLAVGLSVSIGRFVLDAWLRARTSYGVTDRRILIHRAAPFGSFTSLDLATLPQVDLAGEGKPRGSIRFGPALSFNWAGGGNALSFWVPSLSPSPTFLGIEEPRRVFDIIMRARG